MKNDGKKVSRLLGVWKLRDCGIWVSNEREAESWGSVQDLWNDFEKYCKIKDDGTSVSTFSIRIQEFSSFKGVCNLS